MQFTAKNSILGNDTNDLIAVKHTKEPTKKKQTKIVDNFVYKYVDENEWCL